MVKIIRVGFIGAGGASYDLFPGFLENPNAEIVAVMSRTEQNAKKAAKEVGSANWYTDHRTMLRQEDLDAVCVTTPNALHMKHSITAMEAGNHVLCEKPMALTTGEAIKMDNIAKKNNVILMPAYCERFQSIFEHLKKILDKELFGKITFVRGRKAHLGPDIAWRPQATWFFDQKLAGGGALLDLGSHVIDYLMYLFGGVYLVIGASLETRCKKMKHDDTAAVLMEFRNGIPCVVEASWCSQYTDLFEIHGTKGRLQVSRSDNQLITAPKEFSEHPLVKPLTIDMFMEDSKKKEVDHFIDCIINKKTPRVTALDGLHVIDVVMAAKSVGKQGAEIPAYK